MKKTNIIHLITLLCVLVCVCVALTGCDSTETSNSITANQMDFLKDMASGINDRLSQSDKDTSSFTHEELMEHYATLVHYELNKIGKYENQVFEDQNFDSLAHLYIQACTMQLEATENYKNEELYSALWNGGRIARSGLIITLYDRYDLPITADQANNYRTTTDVEYSVSGDTDFLDFFNGGEDDVVLSVGDLIVVDASATFDKGSKPEYDRYEYAFTVKNDSAHNLESISIECVITDSDGNILGTESQWIHNTVASGKSVVLEGTIYLDDYDLPIYIKPDEFSYDGNGDSHSYSIDADPTNAEMYTLLIKSPY